MPRIVINTVGSTGDLFPFIALAQGLKVRGHSVVMAVNPAMHDTINKAGIETLPGGPSMTPEEAQKELALFDGSKPARQILNLFDKWLLPSIPQTYRDLLDACKDADCVIATTIQFAAPMVQEKLGLHWITASLSPCQFETAYDSPPHWPDHRFFHRPMLYKLGWKTAREVARRLLLPRLNRVRREMGFGPLQGVPTLEDFSKELVLIASSPQFSPQQPDWSPEVKLTGYWFYDAPEQHEWKPGRELRDFVARGEKPVVMTLGSMVQRDPEGVATLHADAVVSLGKRLIIQQGWGGIKTEHLKELTAAGHVIGAGFLPHEWLFSHAAAVIHHGGAGTTGRALRHGCPALIEPHGFDQPYNARHVRALGAGEFVHSHQVTPPRLRKKLERVLAPEVKTRAAQIAAAMKHEDGVRVACEEIEKLIGNGSGGVSAPTKPELQIAN